MTVAVLLFVVSMILSMVVPTKYEQIEKDQANWDVMYEEKYEYYDQFPDEHFAYKLSKFDDFFYKYSYSDRDSETKILNMQIIFNSNKVIESIGSLCFTNKDDNIIKYSIDIDSIHRNWILIVPIKFKIEDFYITVTHVKIKDQLRPIISQSVGSYAEKLKNSRASIIHRLIIDEIGEYPSYYDEDGRYIEDFNPAYVACSCMVVASVILGAIGLVLCFYRKSIVNEETDAIEESINESQTHDYEYEDEIEYESKEYQLDEEIIEEIKADIREDIMKEIKEETNIKKVECLHCGSMYKENLDECPNCGSAKIDKGTEK